MQKNWRSTMFDADRPITNIGQDRLNRALFSKYLARSMLDHHDPESLVIGLYGGFGVGKTSIINMVIEELNFAASNLLDEEKPIILNFSPWSYSGQNQLIYSFFRRLSSTFMNIPYLENKERIIHLLELYVSFFTQKPIPKPYRKKRSFFEKLTFQNREVIYGWEAGRDLTLIKAELNELLRTQKNKIIIIIDNIARLSGDEIKQIFQIVKSMGDYANTVYLLAFDKVQVIHALNKIDNDGAALIEKIVQLPFEIPPITQQDLENILTDRLLPIKALVPNEEWSDEYWADLYQGSLKYFFQTCRNITRYVNTLHFSYPRVREVVNPVDFFAITAIEVFLPHIYIGIRDNKDLFTDLLDNVYQFNKSLIEEDKSRCDEILCRVNPLFQNTLLQLLLYLFPRLRHIYQPKLTFYHQEATARKLHRICSPDLFDVYFRLSVQKSHMTTAEFETLLTLSKDEKIFDQALTRLNQDDRIPLLLDQLDQHLTHVESFPHASAIITALLDNGDLFPEESKNPLQLKTDMRIYRIIHTILSRYSKQEERYYLLEQAITKANKSIYIIVYELTMQGFEHHETEDTFIPMEFRDLSSSHLESLRTLAISKIKIWAESNRLITHPKLLPILNAWLAWEENNECEQFVENITKDDRGLIAFLIAIFDNSITEAMTKYEKNPAWAAHLEDIEKFIPAKNLVEHAKTLFEDNYFEKLREREQLALMIFLDAMKVDTTKIIPKTTV